ncbi:hypothetical protein ACGFRG_05720 [Streptomyces sp. NPDC048696]|uniref:hypothetical protein n=1 Tax=Streptomyces sp. NPDC048696 TaxID=3365585 RepID=UPI003717536D
MGEVVSVSSPESAVLDVVFLHGLDGDARKSWTRKDPSSFWPGWLAEDFAGVAVWSVDYEAWSTGWRGHAMPMQDRAVNLMAQLQNRGIGRRPLCFITHSMGGLLAKEILLHAADGYTDYAEFAKAARGVVFLGTPHTGSSLTAVVNALGVVYRPTAALKNLQRNSAHLRQLNDRYRDWAATSEIRNLVFFETSRTKGVRVVDASSANPGLAGIRPIPVDADHTTICKPVDRDSLVYGQVKRFITEIVRPLVGHAPVPDTAGTTSLESDGRTAPGPEDLAEVAINEGRDRSLACDLPAAVEQYEAAVSLAVTASNSQLEVRARTHAARGLIEVLAHSQDRNKREWVAKRERVDEHLVVSEQLGANAADLAVERALASNLDGDPGKTIQLARRALELAGQEGNEQHKVTALVVLLAGYRAGGAPLQAAYLADAVAAVMQTCSDNDSRVVLGASWLRTKYVTRLSTVDDIAEFRQVVLKALENTTSVHRIGMAVDEVTNEFIHEGLLTEAMSLGGLRYKLAEIIGSPTTLCNLALMLAELAAAADDPFAAHQYLDLSNGWAEEVRALPSEHPERSGWETLRALVYQSSGNTLLRLANSSGGDTPATEGLRKAALMLEHGIKFATEQRHRLQGNPDDYLADIRWSLGRARFDLNLLTEATSLFRQVRTAPAMRFPRFAAEVGMPAWLGEAHSLLRAGRSEEASRTVCELLADGRAAGPTRQQAEDLTAYLENTVLPSARWLASPAAKEIASSARSQGLRSTVAEQFAPLAAWWRDWKGDDGDRSPQSGLFDFWGRGGFTRVAAALRAKPHAAIAVDARTLDEIRNWTRVLCPLFDTVVVKWKGELNGEMVMIPQRADYGGPGAFGGHGYYIAMGGLVLGEDWVPATSWANLVPPAVSRLLATEALPLVAAGRLVLLPAPLVGCTQTTVGWTDHLLLELLGGVVNVANDSTRNSPDRPNGQRVLDLVRHSLPYMADISLKDLASVLDETDEWVKPLRTLLLQSLSSDALKVENWQAISVLENDFYEACQQLRSRLEGVGRTGGWHIANTTAAVSAVSINDQNPGHEPITEILRSITHQQRELAPWIPYWRLQDMGGHLDWSHPIDNPSRSSPDHRFSSISHAWLRPGTAGWRIPTVRDL